MIYVKPIRSVCQRGLPKRETWSEEREKSQSEELFVYLYKQIIYIFGNLRAALNVVKSSRSDYFKTLHIL